MSRGGLIAHDWVSGPHRKEEGLKSHRHLRRRLSTGGHGIAMDGVNYLVPVDARLERDVDVRFEDGDPGRPAGVERACIVAASDPGCVPEQSARTVDAADVSDARRQRRRFGGSIRGAAGGRDAGCICGGGHDGGGWDGAKQSLHAGAVGVSERGLGVDCSFRRVRAQVLEATNGDQRPHEHASLVHGHYARGATGPGTATVAEGASADIGRRQETVFWQSIANSTAPADFEACLEQFAGAGSTWKDVL